MATLEPTDVFEFEERINYKVDRRKFNLLFNYNFSVRHFIQSGLGYLDELYVKNDLEKKGPPRVHQRKILLKAEHHLDLIDHDRGLLEGFSSNFYLEVVQDIPGQFDFVKGYLKYRQFFRFLKNDNLAYRIQLGISSNRLSPYPPFVIDSYGEC